MEPWHPVLDTPDDWAANPGWRWPWWKLGMQPQDLFTTLHQQYNTYSAPLQDFEAFHHDVADVAAAARDTADFHRRMALRHRRRLDELIAALDHVAVRTTASPAAFTSQASAASSSSADSWSRAVSFFRNRSLDAVVRYFAGLISPDGHSKVLAAGGDKDDAVVYDPLTPPALDNEADLSVVSTVEDSSSSESDGSFSELHPNPHVLAPTIVGDLSPLRASPNSRHFARPEIADYQKTQIRQIEFPSRPMTRMRKSGVNGKQKSPANKRVPAQMNNKSSEGNSPRYRLRSSRGGAPRAASAAVASEQPQARKRRRADTDTHDKRQRIT